MRRAPRRPPTRRAPRWLCSSTTGLAAALGLLGLLLGSPVAWPAAADRPTVTIPRVDRAPKLEDFLEMKPSGDWEGKLAKVEGFIQRNPSDGQPACHSGE